MNTPQLQSSAYIAGFLQISQTTLTIFSFLPVLIFSFHYASNSFFLMLYAGFCSYFFDRAEQSSVASLLRLDASQMTPFHRLQDRHMPRQLTCSVSVLLIAHRREFRKPLFSLNRHLYKSNHVPHRHAENKRGGNKLEVDFVHILFPFSFSVFPLPYIRGSEFDSFAKRFTK
nr:MAG TPA: hypothetical protein [Caudoviricetes sp.]